MEKQRNFKMNRDIFSKTLSAQKTIQLFQEPPRELFVWSPKQKAENNLLKFNQDKSSIYYPVCLWGHLLLSHKQWRGLARRFLKTTHCIKARSPWTRVSDSIGVKEYFRCCSSCLANNNDGDDCRCGKIYKSLFFIT